MKLSYRAYPHPVVGNADDVLDTAFQASVEVYNDGVNYFLRVNVQCSSKTISKLVKAGDAVYVLHVECSNTLYRQAFEFSEPTKEVMIPGDNLNATVEVNLVARAKRDIKRYRIENAHPDYDNTAFAINPGDILAVAEGYIFDADITFDALRSVSSIVQVRERKQAGDLPMDVDLNGDKITILLSKQDFENYKLIRANTLWSASLISTLVLPALIEAINRLKHDPSDFESYRWSRCLSRRIEFLGLSIDQEPLDLAQRVLELPIRRAFMSARAILEGSD
jgi:hypothetical protein